jgi:single-strand DNA-binding protein
MSFNQITMLGHCTRDPQMKYLANQTAVCEFGIATNYKYGDKEEVCFLDLAAFGKQAETINQYVTKGKQLLVLARLRYETWDDKNGGGKRSKHTAVVEQFKFVGGRDAADDSNQDTPAPARSREKPAPYLPTRPPARPVENTLSQEPQFADPEIPF